MSLRDALSAPLRLQYVAELGPGQPAQAALRQGRAELQDLLPPGYRVRASGAARNLPKIPWLAVLDTEVTATAQEGLYVVYLFAETLDRVYLWMNQGVTAHREYFRAQGNTRPGPAALQELRRESRVLRNGLNLSDGSLIEEIMLGSDGFLPRAYEAGSVVAKAYEVSSLPDEGALFTDLDEFLAIYRDTIELRNELLVEQPGALHTPTSARNAGRSERREPEPVFRPKDPSDYIAHVPAQRQRKTRKHEDLIKRFGEHARGVGLAPSTNVHPRDLVLREADHGYLVEAKTVGNNAELAVRDAIGQLFAYRHFWYRQQNARDPRLIALFSAPIGDAFVELLNELGIGAVWLDHGEWRAAPRASHLLLHGAAA